MLPPPSSSPRLHFSNDAFSLSTLSINDSGMLTDAIAPNTAQNVVVELTKSRSATLRQPRKYVSKHFKVTKRKDTNSDKGNRLPATTTAAAAAAALAPPITPQRSACRIIAGVNIDELSSDSDLTDLPSDIGPDPFEKPTRPKSTKVKAVKIEAKSTSKSPYFPNKARPHFVSCLPFPPLGEKIFGIMQERLHCDPFRLLVATIFLNKTPGERAMPVFYRLMERYPTPERLAEAKVEEVTELIRCLGFQNQRARKCVHLAKIWAEREPVKGRRYRKVGYPRKCDGKDVKEGEVLGDEKDDETGRVGWEISHLPGLGPYSHDSWRMFCRDELRGLAKGYMGEGAEEADFEPEWKRVVPQDKELRAWLTWMWLKEGWVWNKETGERKRADKELMERARGGGIVQEKAQSDHLVVTACEDVEARAIEKPAGEFMKVDLDINGADEGLETKNPVKHDCVT